MKTANILLVIVQLFCSCIFAQSDIAKTEVDIKTHKRKIKVFHQFVNKDTLNKHARLPCDAIIICFEKVNKTDISKSKSKLFEKKLELLHLDNADSNALSNANYKYSYRNIKRILSQKKSAIITHWIDIENDKPELKFNLYDEKKSKEKDNDLYNITLKEIDEVGNHLKQKIAKGNYTHIIVGSHGWNNNQKDAVELYQKWVYHTDMAAKTNNQLFKPLFIGITWPSYWEKKDSDKKPPHSYFNKANDADETGICLLNYLLWKKIIPVAKNNTRNIPIVMIGHSLGARIITDAAFSGFFFKQDSVAEKKIDLIISLQGAFPINRFLDKGRWMKGFYTLNAPCNRFVNTVSCYDNAMKGAFYSKYAGSMKGIKNIKKHYLGSKFQIQYFGADGKAVNDYGNTNYSIAICSDFINGYGSLVSGAHGDVRDKEAGVFIWEHIIRFANNKN